MELSMKEYMRLYRKANAEKLREQQRKYLEKPEVQERRREYYREYARKQRAEMDPEQHEAYLAKQREYKKKYAHRKKIEKMIKALQAEGYTITKEDNHE